MTIIQDIPTEDLNRQKQSEFDKIVVHSGMQNFIFEDVTNFKRNDSDLEFDHKVMWLGMFTKYHVRIIGTLIQTSVEIDE